MDDMSDEQFKALLRKHAVNTVGPMIHDTIQPEDLYEILSEMGAKWKIVWESIPTDGQFDGLYAISPKYSAFLYDGQIFERVEGQWEIDNDVMEWMLDHPPFDCCTIIADLFLHSRGLTAGASPWLLFQYITGIAITSQGMGLNSLMGIGNNDAVMLGRALEAWGEYADIVEPYIELLLGYGAEES